MSMAITPPRRWGRYLLAGYGVLLVASLITRLVGAQQQPPLSAGMQSIDLPVIDGERAGAQPIRLAYREYPGTPGDTRPVVLLIHGSPGSNRSFRQLAPLLAKQFRVIVPDLPGFGDSSHTIPDYSFRAHARYILELMDALAIRKAHLVGFSMGGGVVLSMANIAPERVTSLTMLSAIGLQEMELLGQYHVNHLIHSLQLGLFLLIRELTPHFGAIDRGMFIPYARNFYDSDQRPLRADLLQYQGPMLIVHGEQDPLVPVEAAREHHRIVPQSELVVLDKNHFMVFQDGSTVATAMLPFLMTAETGRGITRAHADPSRITASLSPTRSEDLPKFIGIAAFSLGVLLALATLVSEDLACIAAGVIVAQGRVDFLTATTACFLGIYVGDMIIFWLGSRFGRAALTRAPLRWLISATAVDQGTHWFQKRGLVVIIASRFTPGLRVPTYFAAGMLSRQPLAFAFYFLIASAIWTPLIVGAATLLGEEFIQMIAMQQQLVLELALGILVIWGILHLGVQLSTERGRRGLVGWWVRLTQWEFWPMWAFYPPIILYVIGLGIRYRSLTLFTITNPAIPGSGIVGESKIDILRGLGDHALVARAELIPAAWPARERTRWAIEWMQRLALSYPVALKPNAGERGMGVAIIRSDPALAAYLEAATSDTVIQEYAPGREFGIFYYRYPNQTHGQIFAITDKRFPVVVGDGRRSLEQLILHDPRAVAMASHYARVNHERLYDTPAAGEQIQLVEIGTHSRGAIFLDGMQFHTPELAAAVDQLTQHYRKFYFGRYDVRSPTEEDLRAGRFKAVELNAVTSEATSIYDPRNSLLDAYRILCEQWRIAFAIADQNRAHGYTPLSIRALIRLVRAAGKGEH